MVEPGGESLAATREVDASGRIVAPGFIDVHTHDDNAVLRTPDMAPKISQGVTTVVVGNCGISLSPIASVDPATADDPAWRALGLSVSKDGGLTPPPSAPRGPRSTWPRSSVTARCA